MLQVTLLLIQQMQKYVYFQLRLLKYDGRVPQSNHFLLQQMQQYAYLQMCCMGMLSVHLLALVCHPPKPASLHGSCQGPLGLHMDLNHSPPLPRPFIPRCDLSCHCRSLFHACGTSAVSWPRAPPFALWGCAPPWQMPRTWASGSVPPHMACTTSHLVSQDCMLL